MKRFFLCLMAASTIVSNTFLKAETYAKDSLRNLQLEDVYIIGNRAGKQTPVAQTNLEGKQIQALTLANNIPFVLWMTPSLVATSENGTASGNTYMRIRGTDASRINVTLNGIPLNNPESQDVFWVDIPDISSGLQTIQVQRGVGTSTNGAGAFGASINMTTRVPGMKPYVESATTVGSYGTFQENIAAGTGVVGKGYSVDIRYSKLNSDGYIRNGWLDHESLFASFAKRFNKGAFRFNYIYGKEQTGITWEGISQEKFDTDPTYNPAGEKPDGSYYDNQSDNYWQHHFQFFYTQELTENLLLSAGMNYTNGYGYYEEYIMGNSFSSMGIPNQTVGGTIYYETDLIRRKNMSNGFHTGNLNLQYRKNGLNLQSGAMYTFYDGDHYARLRWVERNATIPTNFEWVRNNAKKTDANIFAKAEYDLGNGLNAYLDLQYRYVDYVLKGLDDDDMTDFSQHRTWNFFNPKAGIFYDLNAEQKLFASVAVANREPARADIKDARKAGSTADIKAERLTDFELGYSFDNTIWMATANVYYMNYKDQLVPTGKLNEVGYVLMSNAPKSYRTGIELQAGYKPCHCLQIDANATLSRNRIVDYTAWYETYESISDDPWISSATQKSQHFNEIKLPNSPEVIAALSVSYLPIENVRLNVVNKYVAQQYYTNTQNDDLKLPAYNQTDFSANYEFKLFGRADANLGVYVNNVFSAKYANNAWGYEAHFANGDPTYTEKGLYVVAPQNYLAKFTVKF
ncbi:MAG TPA: TonB-dependent receptor [Bacteroidales bacterium]|nr:TonB-dependent receptor [Bacteroidales bacterium]